MSNFINDDFLLQSDTAKYLYHTYAATLPIIDYHNHLAAKDIYQNYKYDSIGEAWLSCDHYLWRALRSNGIDEHFVTGTATSYEKFQKFCETIPYLIGNPIYHWCHLELKRYFNLDLIINPENCEKIWAHCQQAFDANEHDFRSLLIKSGVQTLCTTDDPLDELYYHQKLQQEEFEVQVLPTFRADRLLDINNQTEFLHTLHGLHLSTGIKVTDFSSYSRAIAKRVKYFSKYHCRLSDIGMPTIEFAPFSIQELDQIMCALLAGRELTVYQVAQFKTAVFEVLGKAYHRHGWSMQIHIGVLPNVNQRRFYTLGGGTGFSIINDQPIAKNLSALLSLLDNTNSLPQTILYNLNPNDNAILGTVIGAFQDSDAQAGKIQLGSAWWFNDNKSGMENQLTDLANLGVLGRFVGMLTDSRSVLSMSRHEYFRRILCNLIGKWVEEGELQNDEALLKQTIENICYYNAKSYFNF
ncbi:glucuronate isomerase [Vibrio sp. TH_r3]|uniref:glucuronate isomerase n=1 Tax=Vibrio sp. TH_r3 TaxID=3082084 RepID=UPI0029532909|nr:glucuronate isomerase [Vibrio sp. TH_r3]MDV7106095.1 glucuronate isomerase [Vibrio sp. TH_r3]